MFQSLDWVERLSDSGNLALGQYDSVFQSLDWVERLSDTDDSAQLIRQMLVSIPRLG